MSVLRSLKLAAWQPYLRVMRKTDRMVDGVSRLLRSEPPLEPAYYEWRDFYANRRAHYAAIVNQLKQKKESTEHDDVYSEMYRGGGYEYDAYRQRRWIAAETSMADFRGTCLDVGSGDGFFCWLLSEWYHVTGIEPVEGGIELSKAVKQKLPRSIQRRVDFVVGDALKVIEKYDVVFCRGASFFNYPISGAFDPEMYDAHRRKLQAVYSQDDPSTASEKAAQHLRFVPDELKYVGRWRECLEQMLAITNKLLVVIMWTNPSHYGTYVGDTFCHDPTEVARLFAEYGASSVRVVNRDGTFIVAEIYK
jgi:SAM-dependent methyltransferase